MEKQFIHYDMGWPGNQPDVTVFKHSSVWKRREEYFNTDEYVLCDKGT